MLMKLALLSLDCLEKELKISSGSLVPWKEYSRTKNTLYRNGLLFDEQSYKNYRKVFERVAAAAETL